MNTPIRGIVPPLAVPLKDGRLDRASLERHINRMIDAGIHGLFVLGSTGEVVFSTPARRAEILEATQEVVAGRIPVLAGVIDTETDRVIENIRQAESFGVDAVVATAPFYALQGMAEVERHFRLLREATDTPVWAYDIPVCVHTKLPIDLQVRLGQDGVLAGVKDSSGDDVSFRWLARLNDEAGHPLQLLTGHEVVVDGAYMSGADGCVPGLGNVDPDGYVRQWDAYQRGDWEAVRSEQDRLADLMRIVQVSGVVGFGAGVGAFKTSLQLLGVFETNEMPAPVEALTGENIAWVESVLRRAGLLD
ncbi:dihydrodipicolinate synthase family protein [Actinomyces sp. B33]|uniref:dihydrodipicolinate synthase family protein n=1 Tax=Actinomyces sp. B33 TaxID=2942131 RepID=UPI002341D21B|nr:dihydrodipicolinate synthase family protein [Actinomyces sp. B33]MDC4233573.1 dihydrodipicolinate synthase family protein [Actinomyces sp. B33]